MAEKFRLQVNNAPDVHFEGDVIHEYTTQNQAGTKDRWTVIRLYETARGAWIVESAGHSTRDREVVLRDVLVLDLGGAETDDGKAEIRVMEFLGWTMVAKAFAKQAGWDVIRRVA
jgi:hypothetical protein